MELTMKRERLGCCERVFEYCAPAEEAAEPSFTETVFTTENDAAIAADVAEHKDE